MNFLKNTQAIVGPAETARILREFKEEQLARGKQMPIAGGSPIVTFGFYGSGPKEKHREITPEDIEAMMQAARELEKSAVDESEV
jgi:hypothetical protein